MIRKKKTKSASKSAKEPVEMWRGLTRTTSGNLRKIQYYVPEELAHDMEEIALMLGEEKNTPGTFTRHCVQEYLTAVRTAINKNNVNAKPIDDVVKTIVEEEQPTEVVECDVIDWPGE